MNTWGIVKTVPVFEKIVRSLCRWEYPGHKNGCPPQAHMFYDFIDKSKDIFVIYNRFEFGNHVKRMGDKHPEWSERHLSRGKWDQCHENNGSDRGSP